MNHIYTIYKATNKINGKCYIGFDNNWPTRKRAHKLAKRKYVFHNAIRKYGWGAFEWEILYQSKDREYTLKIMEPYFIKENNSFIDNNGYNMTYGGEGTIGIKKTLTEEHKNKIGLSGLGRKAWNKGKKGLFKHSEEHKKYISEIQKGKKISETTKQKMSLAKIGIIPWKAIVKSATNNKGKKQKPEHIKKRFINRKKEIYYKCFYCNISTNMGNLNRWHNEKCKNKPVS